MNWPLLPARQSPPCVSDALVALFKETKYYDTASIRKDIEIRPACRVEECIKKRALNPHDSVWVRFHQIAATCSASGQTAACACMAERRDRRD